MDKQESKTTTPRSVKKSSAKSSDASINWQSDDNQKREFSSRWYIGMVIGFLALLALAIFLIKSWSFVVLLAVSALALVVFIRRPNKPVHYSLSPDGVSIDGVNRSLDDFKAFGIITNLNGSFRIGLIPTKRLSPTLEIDINTPEEGEKIVDFLGARLPMKELELNFIDQIVQRIGLQ